MPIVRTKQEMEGMQPGEILEIMADDPGFEKDIPAWCALSGLNGPSPRTTLTMSSHAGSSRSNRSLV